MGETTWKSSLARFSIDHPGIIFGIVGLLVIFSVAMTPWIKVNTDPEDMLPDDHEVRVQDDQIKDNFFLHDMVALAIEPVESGTDRTVDRLKHVKSLIDHIQKQEGVISQDIISLYTSDDIEGITGGINVDRLQRSPPENEDQLDRLKERLEDHPILKGMIFDRKTGGIAVYVPVEAKKYSYNVRTSVQDFWAEQVPDSVGKLHVTGLPVAEKTFGVEMFKQMAISAPMAFVLIGILMLFFFGSFSLVLWSLIQAAITVVITMGGLIGLGFTVHIMSSMIPIFLLPIAVVDSIHILSDFTDRMTPKKDFKTVLSGVYEEIFYPILFTSVTSSAGFFSLIATGIPPVEVFGGAVGFGILLAFVLTLTVLPAGASIWQPRSTSEGDKTLIARILNCPPEGFCLSRDYSKSVIVGLVVLLGLGLYGMSLIQVNDNPTRWFFEDHPIRQADNYINSTFAGSYPAYLKLSKEDGEWYEPPALEELRSVTDEIESMDEVGKVTALPNLVTKIHREIMKDRAEGPLPNSDRAVSQYLFLYENSGNPQDLFRLVTSSGDAVNLWFNLKSGDNRDMSKVKRRTERELEQSDLEFSQSPQWAGITYVNLVWQNVMVRGMAWALAGGYVVVFFMMLFLFRSLRWALLSLIPLTVTLIFIYGLVGLVGKDYDMPVAVLSSLSIGIAIDFAIHFIQRSRQLIERHGSWSEARSHVAGEPSRAIARNAIVIAVGFTPLLFAPLRPYFTVGTFMVLIMSFSGLATLIGLNAVIETTYEYLPGKKEEEQ